MKTVMKIEVKGVEFCNKGAELMLHSIILMLEQQFSDYELVLSPGSLLPYQQRARLGAWQKFSFQLWGIDWTWLGNLAPVGIRRLLRHFGIVVEKDINLVLDASGFVYSDKWGQRRLKQTLNHLKRIKKYNIPYVFLSQAFGPFQQPKNARLMQDIIGLSELLIPRDEQSLQSLNEIYNLGPIEKIKYFPDFTPSLDPIDTILPLDLPESFVCIIPNNKMFARQKILSKQTYINFLVAAIKNVETMGLTPILLNHEGKKDYDFCLELITVLENKILFINDLNSLEIKKIIGLSVFCISSRYHGCVSSLSQGVPTLATSWSHKYEELYRYYQHSEYLVDVTVSGVELKEKMLQVVIDRENISSDLLKQAEIHKASVRQMWTKVFSKISS
jgi:polysaccharide pyruvyl transferase WcaK-like protein